MVLVGVMALADGWDGCSVDDAHVREIDFNVGGGR